MTARIRDLLRTPQLRDLTHLVSGARDASVVSVLGETGSVGEISRRLDAASLPGTALVLLDPLPVFDARFDVLLRRAWLAGITVVVLTPSGAPAQHLPAGVDALAARLGVVVLTVTDPWRFSVEMHAAIGDGAVSAAHAALKAASVGLNAGDSLEETMNQLEQSIGYPLELFDAAGRSIRGELTLDDRDRRSLAAVAATNDLAEVELDDCRLLAIPLGLGLHSRPWLAIVSPSRLIGERTVIAAALRVASVIIAHQLMMERLINERDARYRSSLLEELRSSAPSPPPSVMQRAISAGWRLDGWHIGIRLVARNADDLVAAQPSVEAAFASEDLRVEAVEQIDGWALWLSEDTEPRPGAVRDIAARVQRAQLALAVTVDTNVGVGSVQSGASGLIRSLTEASDAARLAAGRAQSGHFVHVDGLGLAQLLLAWTQTDTFLPAAHQLLAPLAQSSGNLLETLALYLDSESSLARTASALGIHRNTVADRISRVERLLGIDLGDAETRLALHLAVRTARS